MKVRLASGIMYVVQAPLLSHYKGSGSDGVRAQHHTA